MNELSIQPTVTMSVLAVSVLTAAIYDVKARRIPNALNVALTMYGLMFHLVVAGWKGLLFSLAGLAVGLVLMLIPYALKGMGAGDVKLMAAVGSVVGTAAIVIVFALASLIGAVLSVLALHRRRKSEKWTMDHGRWTMVRGLWSIFELRASNFPEGGLEGGVTIPYGVAISLSVLSLTGFWMLLTLNDGRWTMDDGRWSVVCGLWSIVCGLYALRFTLYA
jgi:prepilin peptidase CpaA